MFKIITVTGGLGNQMFAYAFYLGLKKETILSFVELDIEESIHHHNGFELDLIFLSIKKKSKNYYSRIRKLHTIYFTRKLFRIIEEERNDIHKRVAKDLYPFQVIRGYWQSEIRFIKYEAEIRKKFQFNTQLLNKKSKLFLAKIQNCESVSIHIRRGDYLHNEELNDICTIDYYSKAIDILMSRDIKPIFFLFSNDRKWIAENFNFLKYHLVDCNNDKDNWQDMFLMSQCKHNIIANSTFSWWGAWLNDNVHKVVIAPQKWFQTIEDNHIVPEDWQKIA